MKHCIVILAMVLLSLSACLGQVSTIIGEPHPFIDSQKKIYFAEDKEILAIKIGERRIHLQKFSAENLSADTREVYDDMPRGALIEKIAKLKHRYFLFYSQWDGENQNLLYREINFKEGTFVSIGENIFMTKGKIAAPDPDFPHNRFKFSISADSTRILVLGKKPPLVNSDSKNFDMISMQVYDENLKILWSREVPMPYTEKLMDPLNYSVDSKGNVSIVVKIFNEGPASKENYRLEILHIEAGKEAVSRTLVASVGKFVKSTWVYEHPEGYLIGVGTYNLGQVGNDNTDGIILFKVSSEWKLYDATTYEIPMEVVNLYDKTKDGHKEKFEGLAFNSMHVKNDGSLLLIGEQKNSRQGGGGGYYYYYASAAGPNVPSGGSSSSSPVYLYNDLIVTKIDRSGKLVWMRRLPKKQKSEEIADESYQYANINGKHHFLVIESFKDKDLPLTENPSNHTIKGPGLLTTYIIEDDYGKASKTLLFDTRNVNGIEIFQLTIRHIVRTAENEFVLEARTREEKDILVKVKPQE